MTRALRNRLRSATLENKVDDVKIESPIHTPLTLDDVDVITECRSRLLNAAVLLELGLHHLDDEDVGDPECISLALLDLVDRVREETTMIEATMELAAHRHVVGAEHEGAK